MPEAYKGVLQMTAVQSSIALGFFDGVHTAHRAIIETAVRKAEMRGLRPVVLTFDKAPSEVLFGSAPPYITTLEEKERLINALGAQMCLMHTSRSLLSMTAEEFAEKILVQEYNAAEVTCGFNYRFGSAGSGDTQLLTKLGKRFGFNVTVVGERISGGETVSSSRIRTLISSGRIEEANILLGRSFSISGTVEHGKRLGRTIGFPTANVYPQSGALLPMSGVYETVVEINGERLSAITNTGTNPTVGKETLRTETYIPSAEVDLYGKRITVEFVRFIRPEKKFSDLEALKRQIREDLNGIAAFNNKKI